jgi:hypothetical protein
MVLSQLLLPGDRCGCGGVLTGIRTGAVDVQVKLSTLIGFDEHPGLISGLDSVLIADLARHLAHDPHTRPVWRWSIVDQHGDLLHHGRTRHRPSNPPSVADSRSGNWKTMAGAPPCTCRRLEPGPRRSTIELQLTPATLARLLHDPGLAPGYEAIIADIAAQVADDQHTNPPSKWSEVDEHGNLRHHGHTGRMPDPAEASFIRARDRTCRTPGCPVPSSRCELDHRIEHARGGPSHRGCVDARCKRHHHLRHRRGFHISRTGRTTTWTIPSGRTFDVTPDKDLTLTEDDEA